MSLGKIYFVLAVFLLTFMACHMNSKYKIESVNKQPSLARFDMDFGQKIQSAKSFSENLINSYLEILDKEIHSTFRSHFTLGKSNHISVRSIFSSVRESVIYIFPAEKSELAVDCTKYPIQMTLLSGLDSPNHDTKLMIPYEEAIEKYNKFPVMFNLKENSLFYISKLTLNTGVPKVFEFGRHSIVTLYQVRFELRQNEQTVRTVDVDAVGILTGEDDFSWALEKAREIGANLIVFEIMELLESSPYFREALAHPKLKTKAEEIQRKRSRAEKDPSFEYPYWQFKSDISKLTQEARKLRIDTSYVEELLKDPSLKPHDGNLLWYYSNCSEFMLQWVFINSILLLLIVLLLLLKHKDKHIIEIALGSYKKGILPAIILTINGWIFWVKPNGAGILYWVLPGAVLLICLAFSLLVDRF